MEPTLSKLTIKLWFLEHLDFSDVHVVQRVDRLTLLLNIPPYGVRDPKRGGDRNPVISRNGRQRKDLQFAHNLFEVNLRDLSGHNVHHSLADASDL